MAFDTFDEGITPGGIRSKNEIKTLICYLFNSVKENMDKDMVVQAILKQGLANYFETTSAFDDLVTNGNLIKSSENDNSYSLSENGIIISNQLDSTLAYSVKEKALDCALKLLAEKKTARENTVEISKTDNGYTVECTISGGEVELFSFKLYAPQTEQALIIKKNFLDNPEKVYKVMLALMTKDKDSVGEALEELYGI